MLRTSNEPNTSKIARAYSCNLWFIHPYDKNIDVKQLYQNAAVFYSAIVLTLGHNHAFSTYIFLGYFQEVLELQRQVIKARVHK